jgi:acetyl-CoA carboxylase biotin carboxylase subunit
VYAGYTVPPYYDSLVAKLIVQGSDRAEALKRMQLALETFVIEGVATTMPFLARVMQHPQFQAGDVDTKWLEREFDRLRGELQRPEAHPPSTPAREA